MKSILKYKSFFAYSQKNNKYFFTDFSNEINIVYGRNTSGKSTLIQSILYTFGINNDVKTELSEIIDDESPIFRLDCEFTKNKNSIQIILIRDNENIYIKKSNEPIKSFFGIGGNNSKEHNKLKEYLHDLFNFNLLLQQKSEIVKASIETIFLPYYISQSTGWVNIRKSFGGTEFYKNFKSDYLDYYLGIENTLDRLEKQKLEQKKETYDNEVKFYNEFETKHDEITLTKLMDEHFINEAKIYIEEFKDKQSKLIIKEKEYIEECNKLSFYNTKLLVLRKVKGNITKQNPEKDKCPICSNQLNSSLEKIYSYQQDFNDTLKQIEEIKTKQKATQSKINSLDNELKILREEISDKYEIVKKYNEQNITFEKWLDSKSNIKLIQNISSKISIAKLEIEKIKENLAKYKTDKEIEEFRKTADSEFSKVFKQCLEQLEVKNKTIKKEYKYSTLYQSSIFPLQGVELHKAVLAHNFAFNKYIQNTEYIHRLPFLIDAIFKEDIDDGNKAIILNFVNNNKPNDTQLILSIAYKKDESNKIIEEYNKKYFNAKANLICIGDGINENSFLQNYNNEYEKLLNEIFEIIENS